MGEKRQWQLKSPRLFNWGVGIWGVGRGLNVALFFRAIWRGFSMKNCTIFDGAFLMEMQFKIILL